jgi:fumarate reductase flavoprotein subunit
MTVEPVQNVTFAGEAPVLIIGAGAAGLIAALAARERGVEAVVVERDAVPRGSTALSAGLIPAGGTRWQTDAGIVDNPAVFAADIQRKAHNEPDARAVHAVTRVVPRVLEWLTDRHGLPFSVITNFSYPGHSAHRMHGLPSRSGAELIDRLRDAAVAAGVEILTSSHATTLYAEADGAIRGVGVARPDGTREPIGCQRLVLACNGYGGNPALVRHHIPELADAVYFGHAGNRGDAILWGAALGAVTRHLSGHQGHGSVAHPHGVLITWATIMEGGVQVNRDGARFWNEAQGYSEAATAVLAEPGGVAFNVFDARIAAIARQFEDFRKAEASGAVLTGATPETLAAAMHADAEALIRTMHEIARLKSDGAVDRFGRNFAGLAQLAPPYHAVRVTGALFHTQGGLVVDEAARVLREDATPLPNLFAAGGAACGVSGSQASGYLSGNGLLTAVAYGYLAGRAAAER